MKEEDILLSIALDGNLIKHQMLNIIYQVARFLMTCESQVKHGYGTRLSLNPNPITYCVI